MTSREELDLWSDAVDQLLFCPEAAERQLQERWFGRVRLDGSRVLGLGWRWEAGRQLIVLGEVGDDKTEIVLPADRLHTVHVALEEMCAYLGTPHR